jgi:hypothetical protein
LKLLFSPDDRSIFILGASTHPDGFPNDSSYRPKQVPIAIEDYHDGIRLGLIDIDLYKGDSPFQNLSQIYETAKYARIKASENRRNIYSDRIISAANKN